MYRRDTTGLLFTFDLVAISATTTMTSIHNKECRSRKIIVVVAEIATKSNVNSSPGELFTVLCLRSRKFCNHLVVISFETQLLFTLIRLRQLPRRRTETDVHETTTILCHGGWRYSCRKFQCYYSI